LQSLREQKKFRSKQGRVEPAKRNGLIPKVRPFWIRIAD